MTRYNPQHYKKHKSYFSEYYKEYYKKHKEEIKKRVQAYREEYQKLSHQERMKLASGILGLKCEICGFESCVEIHHILSKSEGGKDDPENLIALCPNHHILIHKYGYNLSELKQEPFPKYEQSQQLLIMRKNRPYEFKGITLSVPDELPKENLDSQLKWVGAVFGLFSERDKEDSCFRVFIEILKAMKEKNPILTTEMISERTNLSKATALYHLRKLVDSGIVEINGRYYVLNGGSFQEMVRNIRQELAKIFLELEKKTHSMDIEIEKRVSKDGKTIIL